MQRVNTHYDTWDQEFHAMPFRQLSLGNLFIGARSRHVADCLAFGFQPAHRALEEARRRTNCSNNLHQIALGMLLYHHERGTLPPAYTIDANGKPLHSWRVLLLPYVGEEKLFSQIRVAEPWNSVHNCQFHDAAVAIYQCPSALAKRGDTTYSVIIGQHTAIRPAEGRSLDDLGMNSVLVVERWTPVCWMDPTSELTEAIALKGINRRSECPEGIGSQHPGGAQAALRDGSARFISHSLETAALQSLLDGTAKQWPQ